METYSQIFTLQEIGQFVQRTCRQFHTPSIWDRQFTVVMVSDSKKSDQIIAFSKEQIIQRKEIVQQVEKTIVLDSAVCILSSFNGWLAQEACPRYVPLFGLLFQPYLAANLGLYLYRIQLTSEQFGVFFYDKHNHFVSLNVR